MVDENNRTDANPLRGQQPCTMLRPTAVIASTDITALILAGGKSRRMGGTDKGLLAFGDDALIGHIARAVQPQVYTILISANRNRDAYAEFGWPVLPDPLGDFQGPLAGFLAGLQHVETEWMLTLPCDGPVIVPDLVSRLAAATADDVDIVVAHDGQRLQPVYTLMHRRVLPGLRETLAAGERKIDRWFPKHSWVSVDFSDVPQQFSNINTPADYAAIGGSPVDGVER